MKNDRLNIRTHSGKTNDAVHAHARRFGYAETVIRDTLAHVASQYQIARANDFTGNTLASYLRHQAPEAIRSAASISETYKVVGSAGAGNWAEIAWIAVLDPEVTTSPQREFYVVYLFSSDLKTVVLSVAIGWTQFEEEYGAHGGVDKITKSVQYLRRKLRSTSGFQIGRPNLSAQHSLGRGYEAGTVCFKVYPSSALPEEAVLIDDLRNALGLYRELKGLTGANILNLDVPETPLADPEAAVEELHRASANVRTPEEAQALINSYTEHVSSLPADVKRRIGQAFKRDQKLSRLVKEAAGYRCQICRESGFSQPSGTPYAEAHHTLELSHGGLDLPANMVCVCPTCHAIIHHGTQEGLNQRKHSA